MITHLYVPIVFSERTNTIVVIRSALINVGSHLPSIHAVRVQVIAK